MRIRNEEDPNGREHEDQEGRDGGDAVIRTYYMKKNLFSVKGKNKRKNLRFSKPIFQK